MGQKEGEFRNFEKGHRPGRQKETKGQKKSTGKVFMIFLCILTIYLS